MPNEILRFWLSWESDTLLRRCHCETTNDDKTHPNMNMIGCYGFRQDSERWPGVWTLMLRWVNKSTRCLPTGRTSISERCLLIVIHHKMISSNLIKLEEIVTKPWFWLGVWYWWVLNVVGTVWLLESNSYPISRSSEPSLVDGGMICKSGAGVNMGLLC